MIQIKHLSFSYGEAKILDDINLSFGNNGLVAICGDSGCGKTTFLNCLSGLLKSTGSIEIDRENINTFSEDEMGKYRLKNIGFIFQDFKLFESENINQNILFPLDVLSSDSDDHKKRKCNDLISLVGLSKHKTKKIQNLSGGEKQRVAIARALVNDPKIILADEPTGSLDSQNSQEIMSILAKISRNSLVFVVSHDVLLMREFADQIIQMKDGEIEKIEYLENSEKEVFFPVCKNKVSVKKASVTSSFLFRHSKSLIQKRKWRTLICNFVTSLGLLGVGLSFSISRLISTNINSAYSSIVDESKIMISQKNGGTINGKYHGLNRNDASKLAEEYSELSSGYGIYYQADFESYFCDSDQMYVTNGTNNSIIPNISGRHINEFEWLDQCDETVYPHNFNELKNNEIVLGVNIQMISELCYINRIEKTLTSLSKYLEDHSITVFFDFAHFDWQYFDQQLLSVVGVVLTSNPCIFHTNHFWNEYMLEDQMRFPANENLHEIDYYPWTMKKVYYLYSRNQYDFLKAVNYNFNLQNHIFDLASITEYPFLYRNALPEKRNRFLIYEKEYSGLACSYEDYFYDVSEHIFNPVFGSLGGYCIFPSYFMMGFSGETFFSFNQSQIETVKDDLSLSSFSINETYTLPEGVASGHYSKSMENGVIFQGFAGNLLEGREPKAIDEIAISSRLLRYLTGSTALPNRPLYLSYTKSQILYDDGSSGRNFADTKLQVVGVVNSSRLAIFHEPFWTISFFEIMLGVSAFDLEINTISFEIDATRNIDSSLSKIKKAFPQFEVTYPLNTIKESISKICGYIEVAILCLSSLTIIVSILLLSICNYLHALECQRDIGLARCLGVSNKESNKFIYSHSILMALSSFLCSAIELVFITFVASYYLADSFGTTLTFNLSITSFIIMLFLSIAISIISSLFIAKKTRKKTALECLKA